VKCITALAFAFGLFATTAYAIAPGERLPNVSVQTPHKGELRVSELRGKVFFLEIWASWCKSCQHSLPWMATLYERFPQTDFEILAVSVDSSRAKAEQFLKIAGLNLPVGYDPEGLLPEALDSPAMPSSYLIGRDGRLISAYAKVNHSLIERAIEEALSDDSSR
jgi:cytochrome c biogenesis protein CcmG, thiol:disulfide interchange protein DsbE